ncbi:MAG TPA: HAMP domain-containing sensor histidine kinase [Anaerolineales bacterium]|nr:HAMP domain-containing sensor histidine kinase [Anaerolineales bacterium]
MNTTFFETPSSVDSPPERFALLDLCYHTLSSVSNVQQGLPIALAALQQYLECEQIELHCNELSTPIALAHAPLDAENLHWGTYQPEYATVSKGQTYLRNGSPAQVWIPLLFAGSQHGVLYLQRDSNFTPADLDTARTICLAISGYVQASHAQNHLQEAFQEKHRYVSTVTHELKVPLTAIKGYTDLVLTGMAGDISDVQKQFLSTIRSNVNRMSGLISDLADISRIETGRLRIDLTEVNLNYCVQQALRDMEPQFTARKQQVLLSLPETMPTIISDYSRVIQILTNLLSNANKYSADNGQVNLRVQVEPAHILISVQDNGIGISAEDQLSLFTPFFRSESREVRSQQGWGLGLHVTKRLVDVLGGQIHVQSQLGSGTTFTIILPR